MPETEFPRRHYFRHGLTNHPIYKLWTCMIYRCHRPKDKSYKDYGGRGIFVCDRWQNFALFVEDMGDRPPGLTIDRIDNNKGYEPGNCRWATRKVQQNNTRRCIPLSYNDRTQTLTAWANEFNIHPNSLKKRLELGWTLNDALTRPRVSQSDKRQRLRPLTPVNLRLAS